MPFLSIPPAVIASIPVGSPVQLGHRHCRSAVLMHWSDDHRFATVDAVMAITKNGKETGETERESRVVRWTDIRLLPKPGQQEPVGMMREMESMPRVSYQQRTIGDIIHMIQAHGLDNDPPYQRGHVWTDDDRQRLIDSICVRADIGKIVLIELPITVGKPCHEVLDGKQRLHTIQSFMESRFPYRGKVYAEWGVLDQTKFENTSVSVGLVHGHVSEAQRIAYFLHVNRTGRSMDPEHLRRVEAMLPTART
jgi:hypothetical protein